MSSVRCQRLATSRFSSDSATVSLPAWWKIRMPASRNPDAEPNLTLSSIYLVPRRCIIASEMQLWPLPRSSSSFSSFSSDSPFPSDSSSSPSPPSFNQITTAPTPQLSNMTFTSSHQLNLPCVNSISGAFTLFHSARQRSVKIAEELGDFGSSWQRRAPSVATIILIPGPAEPYYS